MTSAQQPDAPVPAAAAEVVDEQGIGEMKQADDSTTQKDVTAGDDEASKPQDKADEVSPELTDTQPGNRQHSVDRYAIILLLLLLR